MAQTGVTGVVYMAQTGVTGSVAGLLQSSITNVPWVSRDRAHYPAGSQGLDLGMSGSRVGLKGSV